MHPDLAKHVSAGKLPAPAAEKLSRLEPDTYCVHPSWGAGQIKAWDLAADKVVIDFEGKPGHDMKLEFAAKSIVPLPSSHILARRVADPAGTSKLAR
jgi:transcription elongation factor GreA-like protein